MCFGVPSVRWSKYVKILTGAIPKIKLSVSAQAFQTSAVFSSEHTPYHIVQNSSVFEVRQFHVRVETDLYFERAAVT